MTAVRVAGIIAILALGACGGASDPRSEVSEPRGERIVFSSNRDGDFEIYVMRPRTRAVRQLTRNARSGANAARDEQPTWSPDGRMIAFASTRDHESNPLSSYEIYVMNADGRNQRRLTDGSLGEFAPQWTGDGRILFSACGRDLRTCRLESIRPDGSDRQRFGNLSPLAVLSGTALSPDGSSIAFVRPETGGFWSGKDANIYVSELDGSHESRLTENAANDGAPAWSPDGSRIAFVSDRDKNGRCLFHDCTGNAGEIYVMDADGSRQARLTRDPASDGDPTWSPDGTRIVFTRIADESDDHDLYVVNADGSCETRLTDGGAWDWMPDIDGDRAGFRPRC
ncbi:MAG: PD40 domain-containing protein [Actinobacteria bacterium]|nr:PD40 domain-containing protein [Actinomycetota bacterium]